METGLPLAQEADERDERNERGRQVESLACIFLFSILLTMLVGTSFLSGIPQGASFGGWVASLVGLASTGVFVNLLLLIPVAPAAILVRRWWFTTIVVPVLFAALVAFIFADSVVFRLYRFHVNGMVLAIMFAPAADDSFTLGASTYRTAVFWVVVIVAAELGFSLGAR